MNRDLPKRGRPMADPQGEPRKSRSLYLTDREHTVILAHLQYIRENPEALASLEMDDDEPRR
jgi:hypothetical protein